MQDYSDLTVRLKGDATGFKTAMDKVKGETDKTGGKLKSFTKHVEGIGRGFVKFGKIAATALAAAGAAVVGFGAISVKAFTESQNVQAQLQAVLASTHNAAKINIEDLNKQAAALQRVTKFSDETIGSAQGLMLTFTSIGKEVFPQALEAALDMSTALNEDLQSSVIRIGKALQDPILGMTALRKAGVNVNQAFKDHVKALVDAGKVQEAQKFILKELQVEFGGSAKAAGKTFGGQLIILKNALNDIQETIGALIVQYLTPLVQKIAEFVKNVDWEEVMRRSAEAIKLVAAAISTGITSIVNFTQSVVTYMAPGVERFMGVLRMLADTFMTHLWPSILSVYHSIKDRLWPQIKALWDTIEPGFTMALKVIGVILGVTLVAAIKVFLVALNVVISTLAFGIRIIRNLIGWVGNIGGVFINVFRGIPNAIGKAWNSLVGILTWPFKTAFNMIADLWNNTVGKLSWTVPDWVPGLGGKKVGAPKIPKLAAGGIVTSPTLAMLAEAGRPEAVIPLDSRGNMAPGVGGNTFNFAPVFKIGMYAGMPSEKREIAVDLWRELTRVARAHGVQLPQIGVAITQ